MATKYDERLNTLRQRRSPQQAFTMDKSIAAATYDRMARDSKPETYETKGNGTATRYALGCTEEMKPEYTKISLRDGERVSEQLKNNLVIQVETRLQGSVPLNVHIRASSDVDLLVLATGFFTFDTPTVGQTSYIADPSISPLGRLLALRSECETVLQKKYPAANVDISGAKAIAVSGGSLARKVDVVPAHWHDNADYQRMNYEYLRGVKILDKDTYTTHGNLPFLHMEKINQKDTRVSGNAKRAIRLLKCLSRDSEYNLSLTSFDLAGLVYSMTDAELVVPWYQPLRLLNNIEQFLLRLQNNQEYAESLDTPDQTRKIVDNNDKWASIILLRLDLTDLIKSIGAEYAPELPFYSDPTLARERAQRVLNEAIIV